MSCVRRRSSLKPNAEESRLVKIEQDLSVIKRMLSVRLAGYN
jgi:hypothetical protein